MRHAPPRLRNFRTTGNGLIAKLHMKLQAMLRLFANSPNTYFQLNVEQGMQGIEPSEWEKLANVEAHTTQYMRKIEVDDKLGLLVNVIIAPRVQLTIEQLSKEGSFLRI